MKNAWYAVAASPDVHDKPLKVILHSEEILLFRSQQCLIALHNRCPHRGCDLSLGKVDGSTLTCPYHGWRFDQDGMCQHIPSNPPGTAIPAKARVQHYPTREENGLVWVFMGNLGPNLEAPPLRLFPELGKSSYVRIPFQATWRAHLTRVVESVLDVSHLPFVHPETTGQDVNPVVEGLDYVVTNQGMTIYPAPFAPAHPMEPNPFAITTDKQVEIECRFPNHWIIRTPMGDDKWMCTYLTFSPIREDETAIFGIAMRNFDETSSFLDLFHIEHTRFVMEQDRVIVESLRPYAAPFRFSEEVHTPSDAPSIRYRKWMRDAT